MRKFVLIVLMLCITQFASAISLSRSAAIRIYQLADSSGGTSIEDNAISSDTTWSSSKINQEIDTRILLPESFKPTPPKLSEFEWVNQGTASAVEFPGGIFMKTTALAGYNLRCLVKGAPLPPYTITALIIPQLHAVNYNNCGLVFYDSSSGKLSTLAFVYNGNYKFEAAIHWTNATTHFASKTAIPYGGQPNFIFLRIKHDGAALRFYWSIDNSNYHEIYNEAVGSFLTPDKVGFYVHAQNATYEPMMTVLSWEESVDP